MLQPCDAGVRQVSASGVPLVGWHRRSRIVTSKLWKVTLSPAKAGSGHLLSSFPGLTRLAVAYPRLISLTATPCSPDPDQPLHTLNQLLGVVTNTIFENDFDVFDVSDLRGRVAFHDHQVGLFSDGD